MNDRKTAERQAVTPNDIAAETSIHRPEKTAAQLVADDEVDISVRFQAYSHLSRMHGSSSTSFFTLCFGYLAYLGVVANVLGQNMKEHPIKLGILLMVPILLPAYQFVKWFETNKALKKAGEKIKLPGKKDLHQYVYAKDGLYGDARLWRLVTNSRLTPFFSILFFLLILVYLFVVFSTSGTF